MKRKREQSISKRCINVGSTEVTVGKSWTKESSKTKKFKGPNKTADVPGNTKTKVNWRELKEQKKTLKTLRKQKKVNNHYETIKGAKRLWEELRKSNCPESKKKELTEQLRDLLRGKVNQIARSHDTTRIIQWIIKLGSEEVKKTIVDEVLCDLVTFAQCRYATHTIKCILKYSNPEIRKKVIELFSSNISKLSSSKVAAPLVEEVYTKLATKKDKLRMKQAFYSAFFRSGSCDTVTSISDLFSENPDMKETVLTNTKSTLSKLIEKSGTLNLSLMHTAIYDYLSHCNETRKSEMLEEVQGHIRSLIKSKDGANIVKLIICNGTNKVKKSIVKDFKPDLKSIVLSEHGSTVLLTLIDSIDDTVLMKKVFIPIIVSNAEEIINDKHGKKVLLYLVAHRDPTFFTSAEVALLKQADESQYTKKSCCQRMKELQEVLLDPLLHKIADSPKLWLGEAKIILVTGAILKAAVVEKKNISEVWEKIASYITSEDTVFTQNGSTYNIVENSGLHMVLKKIIVLDIANAIENEDCFSKKLLEKIDSCVLKRWLLLNRGCFLLVTLFGASNLAELLKQRLLDPDIYEILDSQDSQGAVILKNLINQQ